MVTLKNKIKIIESLPPEEKKTSITKLINILLIIIIVMLLFLAIYKYLKPYINAVNIDKIVGKKINITKCNTKDYIIIGNDKTYSLSLTNEDCKTQYYEGILNIKNNEITFKNNIKGLIDNNYNIIINNNLFESDNNE